MKHLLKLMDLSKEEMGKILNLADQLKYEKKNGIKHHLLKGKTTSTPRSRHAAITSFAGRTVSIPSINPMPAMLFTPGSPVS